MSDATKATSPISEEKKISSQNSKGITWGPWSGAFVALGVFLLAQFIGIQVVAIYPIIRHWNTTQGNNWLNNSIIAQFFYVLLAEGLTLLLLWLFIRWRKGSWRAMGLGKAEIDDVPYALIGLVVYFVLYLSAVTIVGIVWRGLNINQTQDIGFTNPTGTLQLSLAFISLVILPPIAEEVMFRGFLFSGLKKRLPLIWAALLTSLLFAFPHLLESGGGGLLWIAGIDTFVLSMVLCYLREKTGRLYAGMGVHALKNFVAFASLYLIHTH